MISGKLKSGWRLNDRRGIGVSSYAVKSYRV